jgi:NitT/TauT family transport system substrate-binding protein
MLYSLALAACAPAAAQQPRNVALGWGAYTDVPQIAQAVDKNLWKETSLAVKIVPFASGRESFEAMIGGQLDFAIITEFPAVIGAMRAQKFGALAVLSAFRGGRIIGTREAGMASLKDLEERKIGLIVGGNWHFALDEEFMRAGVKPTYVNIAQSDTIAALVRGDIHASGMFPTGYGAAKRALGDRYREIRLRNYATYFMLVASQNVLDNRPDVARDVLATLLKGEALVMKDPAESQEATSRYVGKAVTLEAIRELWSEYDFTIRLDRAMLDQLVREGQWIRGRGLIKNVEPDAKLFRGYLREGALRALNPARVTLD